MKFLVDEMPFWADDCPFYDHETCKLDGATCAYMTENTAGNRQAENCSWLRPMEEVHAT